MKDRFKIAKFIRHTSKIHYCAKEILGRAEESPQFIGKEPESLWLNLKGRVALIL